MPSVESAWRGLAVRDVEALHDAVVRLHPGMRYDEIPDFPICVENAYEKAHQRAESAKDYADWREATQGFMLSFRDGHTIFRTNLSPARVRWPGFLIDVRGSHYVVQRPRGFITQFADVPDGSEIVSCDGVALPQLLERRLDNREADWSKEPERMRQTFRLLLDYRLEGPTAPNRCAFKVEGKVVDASLRWEVERWSTLEPSFRNYTRETVRPIGQRRLADGGRWIELGGFGDENALKSLAEDLAKDSSQLRRAPYVVFDVRGNRGGNSTWGSTFGEVLYGEKYVAYTQAKLDNLPGRRGGKLWRASPEAAIEASKDADEFAANGADFASVTNYWRGVADLMRKAPKGDKALVEDPCCSVEPGKPLPVVSQTLYAKPVFVLTDAGCFSSCVLAVATLKHLGAVQVGELTGQNEEFGEVAGPLTTPSGLARYFLPISVIRQNPEGLLQRPSLVWADAMDDDAGLERWIAKLVKTGSAKIATGQNTAAP